MLWSIVFSLNLSILNEVKIRTYYFWDPFNLHILSLRSLTNITINDERNVSTNNTDNHLQLDDWLL